MQGIDAAWAGLQQGWAPIALYWNEALDVLSNPWARAAGLIVIVYFTIRVIASVYSGDKQNSQMGPIAIRPHAVQRLSRDAIVMPRLLMPMNMDGVSARLKIYYVYSDARGKHRRVLVYQRGNARIVVSPVNLRAVSTKIDGQEVPDVATADVCFPPIEVERAPDQTPATPDRARDYVALHKIIDNWHEDDNAVLISLHADEHDAVKVAREDFIVSEARKVAQAREGSPLQRWLKRGAALKRPNVIGSYYVKLEFSHDPWFVLTKHPDRDLKMTAWLTVLTSMFALAMDAWPKAPPAAADASARHEIAAPHARPAPLHTQR